MTNAINKFDLIKFLTLAILLTLIGMIGVQNIAAQSAVSAAAPDAAPLTVPANDNFANAQLISGPVGQFTSSNIGATAEPGEPQAVVGDQTVWYKWVAPSNLSMTFETLGGGTLNDTVMGVYTGNAVANLTAIGFNDDINGGQNRFSRITFIAKIGVTYYIQVRGFNTQNGTFLLQYQINTAETGGQFNFDRTSPQVGAGFSDYSVYRSTDHTWYIRLSGGNGTVVAQPWGNNSDVLYPGDFDGDGNTDIGVWRSSNGTAYVLRSTDNTMLAVQWGQLGDTPIEGDFDGDDKADFAVWRNTNGTFYVRPSSGGPLMVQQFGQIGDYVACGDYDGDGKTDFAVQRPVGNNSVVYILNSSDGSVKAQPFGLSIDNVAPGDYDGDGKNDISVYRPTDNTFYSLRSSDGAFVAVQWGIAGDLFTPGDYVGDNRSDITVYRSSNGTYYSLNAATNALVARQWGKNGDFPVAYSNIH